MRQWTYQYCSEFGWFPQPNMIYPQRSLSLNKDYWINYCKRVFNLHMPPPNVEYAHSYYGDNQMQADNIFFVNSSDDPWQYAAMRYLPDPDNQRNLRTHYINCVDCSHMSDMYVEPNSK